MPAPDLRDSIQSALAAFADAPLRVAATQLLKTLGYSSDKTLDLGSSDPQTFLNFIHSQPAAGAFDETKSLFAEWKSADLLFQLTDEELSGGTSLFKDSEVKPSLLQSYVFFAIELTGHDYARSKLTALARQLNRVFPMPVMVLIKHLRADKQPVLSIAVINRRKHKREDHKDVLEKATIIRDISFSAPHRGHQDILASFAFQNLVHPKKEAIADFDTLHAAWEEIFNIELLNKRFYPFASG
jgi:adenine-specific DNA-methyltransferase